MFHGAPGSVQGPQNKLLAFAEGLFNVVALMIMSRGLLPLFLEEITTVDKDSGSPEIRFALVIIYIVALVRLVPHLRRLRQEIIADPFLWSMMILAMISALWSLDPAITIRRSISLACTMAYALYLAINYNIRQLLNIFAWFLWSAICLSALIIIFFPHLGTHAFGTGEVWTGIYTHKNGFGRIMSLAVFILALNFVYQRRYRIVSFAGILAALILLVMSEAKTGIVACFSVAVCFPIYKVLLRSPRKFAIALMPFLLLGAIIVIWAGWLHIEPLTVALDRDPTLTGRTYLWNATWSVLQDSFLLGYGYNAFWTGPWNPLERFAVGYSWIPNHAHNGILNLWLDLGAVGVLVFLTGYLRCFARSVKLASQGTSLETEWPLLFMTYFASYNIAESSIMIVAGTPCIFWILYVVASVNVCSTHGSRRFDHSGVRT